MQIRDSAYSEVYRVYSYTYLCYDFQAFRSVTRFTAKLSKYILVFRRLTEMHAQTPAAYIQRSLRDDVRSILPKGLITLY